MSEETHSRLAGRGVGHGHVRRPLGGARLLPAGGTDLRRPGRPGHLGRGRERRDLHLVHRARPGVGRTAAVHRRGGPVLLRHGVPDRGSRMLFAFSRDRRRARLAAVAGGRPPTACRSTRSWRSPCCVGADAADPDQRSHRLPGGHLDRGDRAVHRLRPAVPAAHPGRERVRARRLEPGPALQVDRTAGAGLDRGHLRAVPAAGLAQGHSRRRRLRLERRQLRPPHRRGGGAAVRRLVPPLGPALVRRSRSRTRASTTGCAGPSRRRT